MYGHEWKEAVSDPRYKVGDRVRVVRSRYEPTVANGSYGVVHELVEQRGLTVVIDGGDGFDWYFALNEIEPAPAAKSKYKVGQRVRVVKCGYEEGGSRHGSSVGDITTITNVDLNDKWPYEGEKWFYKEHEIEPAFLPGDKVRVVACNGYFVTGDTGTVERQGKYAVFVKHGPYQRVGLPIEPEKLELVEAADAKPKPKFRAGDRVRSKRWRGDGYTIACVKTEYESGKPYTGRTAYDYTDGAGWDYEEDIELVTAAPCPQDNEQPEPWLLGEWERQQPCIVALIAKDGKPRPSSYPHVHATVAAATTEAERLARNNPGQEFAVYQRVAGRVAETHVEMKEVA